MKDFCSQCYMEFVESSFQYNRRINKGYEKTCPDCNRINLAEIRAAKRQKDKDNPEFKILNKHLNKHGSLSSTLVQMKFRIDSESANELINKFRKYNAQALNK